MVRAKAVRSAMFLIARLASRMPFEIQILRSTCKREMACNACIDLAGRRAESASAVSDESYNDGALTAFLAIFCEHGRKNTWEMNMVDASAGPTRM